MKSFKTCLLLLLCLKYIIIIACNIASDEGAENLDIDVFINSYINEVKRTLRLDGTQEHTVRKRSPSEFDISQLEGLKQILRSAIKNDHKHTIRRPIRILGIETSCDDTGCAIVDEMGHVLGESLKSQQEIHLDHGGIIPPVARDLHKSAIKGVVENTLQAANLKLEDLDAIATTLKPGLPLSLVIGMQYGKHLSKISKKPFIPIHHMEAHALTIRMVEKVEFPFLVLLISGGHSLLAIAQSATKFQLLGQSLDDAPGEVMDKALRRLKLRNIEEFRSMSGGQAVEMAASRGNPRAYEFGVAPLSAYRDCNFSFSGFKNSLNRITLAEEKKFEISGGQTLPRQVLYDVCASLQHAISLHLCHRVQRAMEYVRLKELILPQAQNLVVSGGVACNKYIQAAVGHICNEMGYTIRVPPPILCTDNGVMIAWNGIERYLADDGVFQHDNIDSLDIESRCPLGEDLTRDVLNTSIRCQWISLAKLADKSHT